MIYKMVHMLGGEGTGMVVWEKCLNLVTTIRINLPVQLFCSFTTNSALQDKHWVDEVASFQLQDKQLEGHDAHSFWVVLRA